MLDIKFIRENTDVVKKAVKDKQLEGTVDIDEILRVDSAIRQTIQDLDTLRAKRNELDSIIKSTTDQNERNKLVEETSALKPKVKDLEEKLNPLREKFNSLMLWVPNPPASDLPYGEGEEGNKVIKTEGKIPEFKFKPKDHLDLGEALGIIDAKRGAKIGGFRSYFLTGQGMLLEQAILKYALDYMVNKDFTPMNVPVMVNKEFLTGTGYFPWGEEDHYTTQDDQGLVGTAEVSLTAYHAGETLDEADFPIKLTGQSACFRREVGSHGKDTKGIFRVHYFQKVEQVVLIPADEELSREWHDKMLGYAEEILQNLKLPYHVLLMCSGDMGPGQRKKY